MANIIEIIIRGEDMSAEEIKKVEKNLQDLGKNMQKVGAIAATAGIAVSAALFKITQHTAEYGDRVAKFERATGISAQTQQELAFAIERMGGDQAALEAGMRRLTKAMSDSAIGLETYKRSFDRMDVSVTHADGSLKSISDILPEIADWFARTEDATLKAATAQELFGRGGLALVPLLNEGRRGIEELTDRAHELGIVFDRETTEKSEEFIDALLDLRKSILGLSSSIGKVLMPDMIEYANKITDITIRLRRFTEAHPELIMFSKDLALSIIGPGGTVFALGTLLRLIPGLGPAMISAVGPAALMVGTITGVSVVLREMRTNLKETHEMLDDLASEKYTLRVTAEMPDIEQQKAAIKQMLFRVEETVKGEKIILAPGLEFETKSAATQYLKRLLEDIENGAMKLPTEVKLDIPGKVAMEIDLGVIDAQIEYLKRIGEIGYREELEMQEKKISDLGARVEELKNRMSILGSGTEEYKEKLEELKEVTSEYWEAKSKLLDIEEEHNKKLEQARELERERAERMREMAARIDEITIASENLPIPPLVQSGALQEANVELMRTQNILQVGFSTAFASVLREGNKFADTFKATIRAMAQAFLQELARMAAARLAVRAVGAVGFAPLGIMSLFGALLLQRGGTPLPMQGGGTVITGHRGMDTVPALVGYGETYLSHELTDKLGTFIDRMERGELGSRAGPQLTIQTGVITATQQEALRFGRETIRNIESYERSFIVKGEM